MVFSSLLFLFLFLPLFLVAYYLTPSRFRNMTALAGSLVFYMWGAPRFIFALLGLCLANYYASLRLGPGRPPRARRRLLVAMLAFNVAALMYFKYANFFVAQLQAVLGRFGAGPLPWVEVALPIGISFITFQKVSYLVDVYRGTTAPAPGFAAYLLYAALFPQLIAGPIVRYHEVDQQLREREHTAVRFFSGIQRFCIGLARKVLIANPLGLVADRVFDTGLSDLGTPQAWIGVLCYSFQIFFDFAGYSDMAIGLARMMGIEFPENFRRPYIARSFTEFWQRWHISLSSWMREYLYIPLGGNRLGAARTYLNLWLVFLISGFWHGASWTFVVWGAYHGLFLSLDKFMKERAWLRRVPAVVAIAANFALVTLGWVFFRSDTLTRACGQISLMVRVDAWPGAGRWVAAWHELLDPRARWVLGIAVVWAFLPDRWARRPAVPASATGYAIRYAACLALLVLSACSLATSDFNPFIYFRF